MKNSVNTISLFFFIDTPTTEIYTLSLHDALPISRRDEPGPGVGGQEPAPMGPPGEGPGRGGRSEEHTSELQSRRDLVCRLLLEKKKKQYDLLEMAKIIDQKLRENNIT